MKLFLRKPSVIWEIGVLFPEKTNFKMTIDEFSGIF